MSRPLTNIDFSKPARDEDRWGMLSVRERDVLELLAAGHANKEIRVLLNLSHPALYDRMRSIKKKLLMTRRVDLAVWTLTRGRGL